jgi:hypothetical protein
MRVVRRNAPGRDAQPADSTLEFRSAPTHSKTAARLLSLVAIACAVGCSRADSDREQVYPVTGKVTVGGQAAAGAEVSFFGATPELKGPGTVLPAGTTDEYGEFQLRSYEPGDGAPAGKFNVTIFWPEPIPEGADEGMFQPKDRLMGRYLDAESPGLSAEVPVGGGELPALEL